MDVVWQFDVNAFRAINVGWHNPVCDVLFFVVTYFGLGQMPAALVAILYWRARHLKHLMVSVAFSSLVFGLGIANWLKGMIPRERPSRLAFAIPEEPHLAGSFPSGHTTVAFGVATCLWLAARDTQDKWIGYAVWPFAALIGISRIYRGVHWPTDVMAGAFLGTLGGLLTWIVVGKVVVDD